jgi:hypothetical protein
MGWVFFGSFLANLSVPVFGSRWRAVWPFGRNGASENPFDGYERVCRALNEALQCVGDENYRRAEDLLTHQMPWFYRNRRALSARFSNMWLNLHAYIERIRMIQRWREPWVAAEMQRLQRESIGLAEEAIRALADALSDRAGAPSLPVQYPPRAREDARQSARSPGQ